jgi:hypothetical protein
VRLRLRPETRLQRSLDLEEGGEIEEEADFLEEYLVPAMRESHHSPEGVEVFIEEGHAVRNQLVAVIHKELRPAPSIGVVWPRGTESEVAHQLHDGRRR